MRFIVFVFVFGFWFETCWVSIVLKLKVVGCVVVVTGCGNVLVCTFDSFLVLFWCTDDGSMYFS